MTTLFDIKFPIVRPSDATFNILRDAGYSTYFDARTSTLTISKDRCGTEHFRMHDPVDAASLEGLAEDLREMARFRASANGSFELVSAAA